jgi:hypothetical protein
MANEHDRSGPVTIFGPDFPFPFDNWIAHPSGLGSIPAERCDAAKNHDSRVAQRPIKIRNENGLNGYLGQTCAPIAEGDSAARAPEAALVQPHS